MARNGHHLVKQLFLLDEEIEETMTGPLVVTDFETEKNHDILTVNGKAAGHWKWAQGAKAVCLCAFFVQIS